MVSEVNKKANLEEMEDEPLMRLIAEGNHNAFSTLVNRHLGKTIGLAQRYTGNRATAEDIAQEAFTKIWIHAPKWKQPEEQTKKDNSKHKQMGKFTSWFYRVVVNQCYDHHRKRKFDGLDDIKEPIDETPDAAQLLEDKALGKNVQNKISDLPKKQSMALTLCFFEGFTNKEAAEIMKTSVKAIESLLVRARKTLRTSLEPLWQEEFILTNAKETEELKIQRKDGNP